MRLMPILCSEHPPPFAGYLETLGMIVMWLIDLAVPKKVASIYPKLALYNVDYQVDVHNNTGLFTRERS